MKKWISLLTVFLLMSVSFMPVSAAEKLSLHSQYAYLYDRETSLVYFEQKSEDQIYPASMTKILTVSLALDKIDDLHQVVTITKADLAGLIEAHATTAGFYEGEQVTYEDLLYGALLPSGADACNALARLTYGSVSQFVNAMNEHIQSLGLKKTHFQNVTGLHDNKHYTTVKDMSVILNDALKNEDFVKIFEARTHVSSKGNHQWISSLQRGKEMKNIDISHIDGGKSGFTDEAGLTFASTMTIHGHQLILVTAKAKGQYTQNHVKDAVNVYQYMDQYYQDFILYKKNEDVQDYWILKSFQIKYTYQPKDDISILIPSAHSPSDYQIHIKSKSIFNAPIDKGTSIGTIELLYQDQMIYEYPMIINESIDSPFLAIVLFYGIIILVVVFLLLCILKLIIKIKKRI